MKQLPPALRHISDLDPATIGLRECVDVIVAATAGITDVDGAGCLLVDDTGGLRYASASDAPGRAIEMAEELAAEGPCTDAFLLGQTMAVDDMHADTRYPRLATLLASTPIRSVLGVPVTVGDRRVGSLDVYRATAKDWSDDELEILQGCAQRLGQVIAQAVDGAASDPLARQVAVGLDITQVVERAENVLAGQTGLERRAVAARLRQAAAALDRTVAEISAELVESGTLPTAEDLLGRDARLRTLLAHLPGTVAAVFDRDLRYQLVSGGADTAHSWLPKGSEGRTLTETAPADADALAPLYRTALAGDADARDFASATDGGWYWLQVAPVRDRRGELTAGMVIAHDVTEARAAEAAARDARQRFQIAFESSPTGMALLDRDAVFLDANTHLTRLVDQPRERLIGSRLFPLLHPDDRDDARRAWQRLQADPDRPAHGERRYVRPDGSVIWVQTSEAVIEPPRGPAYVVMQCRDITAHRQAEQDLRHLALHDALSGLGNRTLFLDRLEHALARSRRRSARTAVLFCDLDRFKWVNDSFGHEAGDRVLTEVGRRLRNASRAEDTVARLGGDEFAVLCEDIGGDEDAHAAAARLAAAVNHPVSVSPPGRPEAEQIDVGVSVGVAVAGGPVRAADLLREADQAMYEVKGRGGGDVALLTPDQRATNTRRVRLQRALHAAVRGDRLQVAYQPVVDLASRRAVGIEALARWHDPDHGWVPPGEFIPLAEEDSTIVALGEQIMRRACAQAAAWRDAHPESADLLLTVNVSARQLAAVSFSAQLRTVLADTGFPAEQLWLEITETTLVGAGLATVNELRHDLGVRIAVDDFGTGYSSLAYLTRLPVDVLKVDRSFVDGLGRDTSDQAIVDAVVTLGDTLGLVTVAEGVETSDQLTHLRAVGCRYAQGYLFAPPQIHESLPAVLATAAGGRAGDAPG